MDGRQEKDSVLREMELRRCLDEMGKERELTQMALSAQATMLWDYYNALRAQGFADAQALFLAGQWHPLN